MEKEKVADLSALSIAHCHFEGKANDGQVIVLKALKAAKVSLKEVRQVNLHGHPGTATVSFSCLVEQDAFLTKTITIDSKSVEPLPGDGCYFSIKAHIYGCPSDLNDSALIAAMSKFGKHIGIVARQTDISDSLSLQTGVQFVFYYVPKTLVLALQIHVNITVHVWHKG